MLKIWSDVNAPNLSSFQDSHNFKAGKPNELQNYTEDIA